MLSYPASPLLWPCPEFLCVTGFPASGSERPVGGPDSTIRTLWVLQVMDRPIPPWPLMSQGCSIRGVPRAIHANGDLDPH